MCHEVHNSYHSMEQEASVGLCLQMAVLRDAADLLHGSLLIPWYQLPVFNNADMIVRRKGDLNAGGTEIMEDLQYYIRDY